MNKKIKKAKYLLETANWLLEDNNPPIQQNNNNDSNSLFELLSSFPNAAKSLFNKIKNANIRQKLTQIVNRAKLEEGVNKIKENFSKFVSIIKSKFNTNKNNNEAQPTQQELNETGKAIVEETKKSVKESKINVNLRIGITIVLVIILFIVNVFMFAKFAKKSFFGFLKTKFGIFYLIITLILIGFIFIYGPQIFNNLQLISNPQQMQNDIQQNKNVTTFFTGLIDRIAKRIENFFRSKNNNQA